MEYIFGVDGDLEVLKTVMHSIHTDFKGFVNLTKTRGGVTIVDQCKILDHFKSDEDAEGKKYDWYYITDHYRYEDRNVASMESDDALAELSQIVMDQEEALAELSELVSELIEGGK